MPAIENLRDRVQPDDVEFRFYATGGETFPTRHEAVGHAAIKQRDDDPAFKRAVVFAFAVCDCDNPNDAEEHGTRCANCGGDLND